MFQGLLFLFIILLEQARAHMLTVLLIPSFANSTDIEDHVIQVILFDYKVVHYRVIEEFVLFQYSFCSLLTLKISICIPALLFCGGYMQFWINEPFVFLAQDIYCFWSINQILLIFCLYVFQTVQKQCFYCCKSMLLPSSPFYLRTPQMKQVENRYV